jgi:hypothetical protein
MSDRKHHAVSLAAFIGLGILLGLFAGCATLTTCAQPVEAQALQDAAGVLVCANTGKTLAQCEDAQLAVEAGQLTQDALMCGEQAIAAASSGTHAGK